MSQRAKARAFLAANGHGNQVPQISTAVAPMSPQMGAQPNQAAEGAPMNPATGLSRGGSVRLHAPKMVPPSMPQVSPMGAPVAAPAALGAVGHKRGGRT